MVNKEKEYVIALDAGTSSIRILLLDKTGRIIKKYSEEIKQYYPRSTWVEQNPDEILKVSLKLLNKVAKNRKIRAIGIANQRETSIIWHKKTKKAIYPAISWQCQRTITLCEKIEKKYGKLIQSKTGLIVNPYFSATKIQWLLNHYKGNKKDLLFGTVDAWLIWNLTNYQIHATDYTNASRTMLFNIKTKKWDKQLLTIFKIPVNILPVVKKSSADYGCWKKIPIKAVAGDQQAALFGQKAWEVGQAKNTYGTGCFFLLNTGNKLIKSKNKLLTTIAIDKKGNPIYAIEGSIFMAGALLKWFKNNLELIDSYQELNNIKLGINQELFFMPALAGLSAPHWNMKSRGVISGLSLTTMKKDILAAGLEGIAWQVYDLINTVEKDYGKKIKELFVDGGVTNGDNLMQFQSNILNKKIIKRKNIESTGLGIGYLAGLPSNFFSNYEQFAKSAKLYHEYLPNISQKNYKKSLIKWQEIVKKSSI